MTLRLRRPSPWVLAVFQTGLAYALLRYSYVQERLHYIGRHQFDASYLPWAKVLVVWTNVPVYLATFWTSMFWSDEAWDYSKLPGVFIFWLWIGCTFASPTRKRLQPRWWYVAAGCLLAVATWGICDIIRSPFNWANRPQSYAGGRAVSSFAYPAWLLFGSVYCIFKYRRSD